MESDRKRIFREIIKELADNMYTRRCVDFWG